MPVTDFSTWRLSMSLGTALLVTVAAYLAAWNNYRIWEFSAYSPQGLTWRTITRLRDSVERYRQANGKLPAELADVDVLKNEQVMLDKNGKPGDVWGHPLQYRHDGENFAIISFGRDGIAGGNGWDLDLVSDQQPEFEMMSLVEFTISSSTIGMKLSCLVAGLIAFPLCLLKSAPRSRSGWLGFVGVHAITALFAFLAAMVISIVHLPTGH